ncbi:VWA domain-containing protein [Dactylosporangium sp. NPDC051541]|uniref:vWA domain-containing protein n=1 Tax=Dactylosporangium sp. NPDC051541 TaxID=3363977 RepID=UPI0037B85A03
MTAPWTPPAPRSAHNRALITLVIDTSASIGEIGALDGLNQSLRAWGNDMRADANLQRTAQIALVTFGHGGVRTVDASGATTAEPPDPFVDVARFNPAALQSGGYSPMLEGIERGIEIVYAGAESLDRQNLLLAWRPILCLISDGAPTDFQGRPTGRLAEVTRRIRQEEAGHNLIFLAIGVPGADDEALRTLAGPDGYYPLAQVNFMQALTLVSNSSPRLKAMAGTGSAEEIKREFRRDVEADDESRSWLMGGPL